MYKLVIALLAVGVVAATADVLREKDVPRVSVFPVNVQRNIDQFQRCVDASLNDVVGQVNENQLQPLLRAMGDTLNTISKTFGNLAATIKPVEAGRVTKSVN